MFRVKRYRHVAYIYIYIHIYYFTSPPPVSKRSYEFQNFLKVISSFTVAHERSKRNSTWERGLSSLPPSFLFSRANLTKHRWNLISVAVIEFAPGRPVFTHGNGFFFFAPFRLFLFFFHGSTSTILFIYYIEIRYTGNVAVFISPRLKRNTT